MTITDRLDEMQRAADAAIVRDGTYAAVVAIETQPRLIAALREALKYLESRESWAGWKNSDPTLARIAELLEGKP